MREIKFRGLNPDSGEISMVQSISFEEDEIYFSEHGGYCFDIDDCNLMQFTGLTDKNGVEMYTGDVVYIAGLGNCEIGIDKFYGIVAIQGKYETPLIDCILEGDYPVKLGDKYQNPELLL